nr:hypothetical protein [Morchella crassipes]
MSSPLNIPPPRPADSVPPTTWGGRCSRCPPFPPITPPPFTLPIFWNGGDARGGEGGRGGGTDSVLVCLRQTRDASPPTEGTVKAVRQPPRLWIFFFSPCGRSRKKTVGGGAASSFCCAAASPLALLAGAAPLWLCDFHYIYIYIMKVNIF